MRILRKINRGAIAFLFLFAVILGYAVPVSVVRHVQQAQALILIENALKAVHPYYVFSAESLKNPNTDQEAFLAAQAAEAEKAVSPYVTEGAELQAIRQVIEQRAEDPWETLKYEFERSPELEFISAGVLRVDITVYYSVSAGKTDSFYAYNTPMNYTFLLKLDHGTWKIDFWRIGGGRYGGGYYDYGVIY